MTFTAGITGTLNYYLNCADMMGGGGVSLNLEVAGSSIATSPGTYSVSGTWAVSAGDSVVLTFNGSSMAYSNFDLWMS